MKIRGTMKSILGGNKSCIVALAAIVGICITGCSGGDGQTAISDLVADMVDIPGKDYKIGKYEVTQSQWRHVMGNNPSCFDGADAPVEKVSFDDCQEFLKKLNGMPGVQSAGLFFRLPTADEWKYACRAGAEGKFCKLADGSEVTSDTVGDVAWISDEKTHPVGQKKPNAFGLYDMHGNVCEWTQTTDGKYWVFCGGSWNYSAAGCEASPRGRGGAEHSSRLNFIGFRLCASGSGTASSGSSGLGSANDISMRLKGDDVLSKTDRLNVTSENLGEFMVEIPGKGFKMCKCEVTQALWTTVMGSNPSLFKGEDHPVERVSWNDCQEFLQKLNAVPEVKKSGLVYRLPTQEEWEYACRAGAVGKYCKLAYRTFVTENTLGDVAWFGENSGSGTHPVGQKKPNALGLYDMHGNVWEWTQVADGEYRVNCGGGWCSLASDCGSSSRNGNAPSDRDNFIGFRLCASARAD